MIDHGICLDRWETRQCPHRHAMIFLLGFFTWLATHRAVENDAPARNAVRSNRWRALDKEKSTRVARPGLHRNDLHGRADRHSHSSVGHRPYKLRLEEPGQPCQNAQIRPKLLGTSWDCRRCWSILTPGWPELSCPCLVIFGLDGHSRISISINRRAMATTPLKKRKFAYLDVSSSDFWNSG